ncbi:hypothetical protein ZTR_10353 [Talaromyces verruculosus]|nr:hypothetical protein ZTR_10353 [Talaromyces verruculosus]
MDHLPPISTPRNAFEIPYFGGTVYDGLGFFTYPERQNWDPNHLYDGKYGSHSTTEAASFAQAWLYFGALSEVTGIAIRGTNFIRVSPTTGNLIITTEYLHFYLERWRAQTSRAIGRQEQFRERARICLDFMVMFTGPTLLVAEHPEIAVSIDILLLTLVDTFKEIYGTKTWNDIPSVFASSEGDVEYLPGANRHVIKHLKERMARQGWCRNRLASFGDLAASGVLYTLSLMGTTELLSGHERCDVDVCLGNQIDDRTYNDTPRHVEPDCECNFVHADVGEAVKFIQQGKIPIAKIVVDKQQQVRLDMRPYEDGMTYIAISHVWSHGLGNPDHNALRTCQLLQLNKLLTSAYHDHQLESDSEKIDKTYFWIDTLCLPLRPIHWRKAAIKRMRHCYKNAAAVLVIDKHLRRSTAYTPTKTTEPLLQVAISDWRFRVWTLQEAILAKKLLFQFLDMSVDVEELLTYHFSDSSQEELNHVDLFLMSLMPALGLDMDCEPAREGGGLLRVTNSSLSSLVVSLQGRAISKPEDEPVCAASLLDQDHVLNAVLDCSRKEERMKTFWCKQHRIPSWVPFIDGPRLEDPGYKWAPSTLRYQLQGFSTPSGLHDYGEIHPDGLGLMLRKPGFVVLERESARTSGDNAWVDAFSLKDGRGLRYDIARSPDRSNPPLPDLHGGKLSVAVIVSEWTDTFHPRVLIVSIANEREDDVIHCRIICRGIIIVEERFPQTAFPVDSVDTYKARRARDDQCWLLD